MISRVLKICNLTGIKNYFFEIPNVFIAEVVLHVVFGAIDYAKINK